MWWWGGRTTTTDRPTTDRPTDTSSSPDAFGCPSRRLCCGAPVHHFLVVVYPAIDGVDPVPTYHVSRVVLAVDAVVPAVLVGVRRWRRRETQGHGTLLEPHAGVGRVAPRPGLAVGIATEVGRQRVVVVRVRRVERPHLARQSADRCRGAAVVGGAVVDVAAHRIVRTAGRIVSVAAVCRREVGVFTRAKHARLVGGRVVRAPAHAPLVEALLAVLVVRPVGPCPNSAQ